MDCSICTTMPFILRPPRNTICAACYEGGKNLITLTNKLEADNNSNNKGSFIDKPSTIISATSNSTNSSKGLANALKWVKEMKEMEEEYNERLSFLSNFVTAFRHEIHPDIQIKPGNNAPSISAHRALLAVRSDIFRNMLDSDGCKSAPTDAISLPELSYEELESLLEFLYSGTLSKEKADKHVYSLSVAADKYDIRYLQKFCENRMLGSLNATNALDVLEISDICSNQTLKETALNFIVKNMEDVVFTARFDAFALKNPHLIVQITRASFMDIKNRQNVV
ncbi:BTB/POZ domain-containing protein At3g56230 [Impatiens glandulifera]|uniref:BTB/POZ domain-containing protein At3g56230 n=1 Tax=Impatiens glandulifera TaxID=253017 RepID=UPI001FB170F2|nr:BTB/POZ domain-containing protein At3g56230 [Impatiens glandulifera]